MSNIWAIHSLDVWGNEKDGWEINQEFYTYRYIDIDDIDNDVAIINNMIDEGMLSDDITTNEIDINGDEFGLDVKDSDNGYPLYRLVPIGENGYWL